MDSKNRRFKYFGLLLAVVMFLVSAAPAFAQEGVEGTTNSQAIGNQGIFSPAVFERDRLWVTKVGKTELGFTPIRFARDPIFIHAVGAEGGDVSSPFTLTYVWFNLVGDERRGYPSGETQIFFQDTSTGEWRACRSFVDQDSGEDERGIPGRIGCLVTQYNTIYGVGRARDNANIGTETFDTGGTGEGS
jgi:hypothetical protein